MTFMLGLPGWSNRVLVTKLTAVPVKMVLPFVVLFVPEIGVTVTWRVLTSTKKRAVAMLWSGEISGGLETEGDVKGELFPPPHPKRERTSNAKVRVATNHTDKVTDHFL
jgi:hypothetical protein